MKSRMNAEISSGLLMPLAQQIVDARFENFSSAAQHYASVCLLDFLSCAFEAVPQSWSEQARSIARSTPQGAQIIGAKGEYDLADAMFANAVAGHGLVREDMHVGSVTHLGVVVWPMVLALGSQFPISGKQALEAAIAGYEVGACLGRHCISSATARIFRPTGLLGPMAAVATGAKLLNLSVEQTVTALALAANCAGGLNQWGHTGGDEMYFHPGFALRNAWQCLMLARAGAHASGSVLEGDSGFFHAYAKQTAPTSLSLFKQAGQEEILQVFHKVVPACNFAQTPCQAALQALRKAPGNSASIRAVRVAVTAAAAAYPGCSVKGPFLRTLQAKMSIYFGVAATLAHGCIEQSIYEQLDHPEILRLIDVMQIDEDPAFTAAYPARQGAQVTLVMSNGQTVVAQLDQVQAADETLIRQRFQTAASAQIGSVQAQQLEQFVDDLEHKQEMKVLGRLVASAPDSH